MGALSLPPDGRNVYADNLFYDGANNAYVSWTVDSHGQLSYLAQPNLPLYATAGGWPFSYSANGRFVYTNSVCKWDGSVWGLSRNQERILSFFNPEAAAPPPVDGQSSVCSQAVATSSRGYAAVAWNGSYCCGGPPTIVTYAIQPNGALNLVPGSELLQSVGSTPGFTMAFDPSGTYLAVGLNRGIQMYRLQSNGVLAAIGGVQQPSVPFSSLAWDNGNHLYAVTDENSQYCENGSGACGLYIFNSNQGALTLTLTLAPGSPHLINQAESVAVLPGS